MCAQEAACAARDMQTCAACAEHTVAARALAELVGALPDAERAAPLFATTSAAAVTALMTGAADALAADAARCASVAAAAAAFPSSGSLGLSPDSYGECLVALLRARFLGSPSPGAPSRAGLPLNLAGAHSDLAAEMRAANRPP